MPGLLFRSPFIFLSLLGLAIYVQTARFGFLRIDDDVNVYANPYLINLSWDSVARFWSAPYEKLYIPVTYSLWALIRATEVSLGDGTFHPALYHLVNVALHCLCAWLVFKICLELAKNTAAAWFAGILFLVHPFQVEGVAWITSFRGLTSAALTLVFLYHFVRVKGDYSSIKAFAVGVALFLASFLAKPSSVGVLPALLLVGWAWYRDNLKRQLAFVAVCAAVVIPFIILTKSEQPDSISGMPIPLLMRPTIAVDAMAFYWTKAIAAWGFAMDYARSPDAVLGAPAFLSLSVLIATAYLLSRITDDELRNRSLALFGAFFALLLPVSGLVAFLFQGYSTVADRYAYPSLAPFAILFGIWIERLRARHVAVVVLALLALQSAYLTAQWRDEYTLFKRTVEMNPNSLFGHNNLGFAYGRRGDWVNAERHHARASELAPGNPIVRKNLERSRRKLAAMQTPIDETAPEVSFPPDSSDPR